MAVENPFGGDQQVELRVAITSDNPEAIIQAVARLNTELGGALDKTEKWAAAQRSAAGVGSGASKANLDFNQTLYDQVQAYKDVSNAQKISLASQVNADKAAKAEQTRIYNDYLSSQKAGLAVQADQAKASKEAEAGLARMEAASGRGAAAEAKLNIERSKGFQTNRQLMASWDAEFAALERASNQTKVYSDSDLPRLRYALYDVANAFRNIALVTGGLETAFITAGAKYESAFANVQRTADGTYNQVEALRGQLIKMSTEIPVSFTSLSQIATLGQQLGVQTDQVAKFTDTVAKFSAVSGVGAEEAAKSFGTLGTILHFGADQYSNFASAVELVGRKSAATDADILSMTKDIGQQASQAGFSADQVVALAGALGQLRVAPERARGSLTEYFQKLDQAVATGGDALKNFAIVTGLTTDQLSKMVANGQGVEVFQRFLNGLSSSGNVIGTTKALDALGLSQLRVSDTFQRLASNQQVFNQYLGLSAGAYQQNTELNRQFAIILDTLSSKWQIFLNALGNFAAAMGTSVAPALKDFLGAGTDVLNMLTGFIQSPIGQWFAEHVQIILTAVTVYATLRASIALTTAGMLAFRTAASIDSGLIGSVRGLGREFLALGGYSQDAAVKTGILGGAAKVTGAQLATEAGEADTAAAATSRVGDGAVRGAKGMEILRLSLVAAGKATAILILLDFIVRLVTDFRGTIRQTADTWIDSISVMSKAILTFAAAAAQAIGTITNNTQMKTWGDQMLQFLNSAKGFDAAVKQMKADVNDWTKGLPGASDSTNALKTAIDAGASSADNLTNSLGGTSDGLEKAAKSAKNAAEQVHTLADYANDLSTVMKRAFDIRFGPDQGLDTIASAWQAITDRTDAAAQKITEYQDKLASLQADQSTKQYQLSIAQMYGDSLRAASLKADLAKTSTDITNTQSDLSKAQQDASLTLQGNTAAAIQNRSALLGLVTSYEDYLQKLAASGASQATLTAQTAILKQQFIDQATQMGFSGAEVQKYAAAFDDMSTIIRNVPRNVTVGAYTDPAKLALAEFLAKANASKANVTIAANPNTSAWAQQGAAAGNAYSNAWIQQARNLFGPKLSTLGPLIGGYGFSSIGSIFAGGGGGGGGGGGFASGGYTGSGGKFEPAGIVHKGEYVFSAEATRNLGVGNLALMQAIGKSGRGFASGSPSGTGGAFLRIDPRDIDSLARAIAYYGPDLTIDASTIGAATAAYNRTSNAMGRYA